MIIRINSYGQWTRRVILTWSLLRLTRDVRQGKPLNVKR